jgi:hypothetical protein
MGRGTTRFAGAKSGGPSATVVGALERAPAVPVS